MSKVVFAEYRGACMNTAIAFADLDRSPVYSNDLADMTAIYQENVNLFVWQRLLSTEIGSSIQSLIESGKSLNIMEVVTPEGAEKILLSRLPTTANHISLIEDIAELVDIFCCLFDTKKVGLRLATSHSATCPRFHVDNVTCRLVTTYNGPATQWLEHASVERSKLGHASKGVADESSGLIQEKAMIQQVNCGDVALLKGEGWPNNTGGGLVHRSPSINSNTTRLFLSLDLM